MSRAKQIQKQANQSCRHVASPSIAIAAFLALVVFAVTAGPVVGAVFTVKLTNGAEIETRYRPRQSSEYEDKIMLLTEHGNWISLAKNFVTGIESDLEARGFGTVLDSTTVFLGYSPNDAPDPSEGTDELDGTGRLIEYLQGRDQSGDAPYSVPQFVEPTAAGGIPLSFGSRTTPPIGAQGGEPPIAGSGG